jgi:hypothetical protein
MAEQLTAPVVHGQLSALKHVQPLGAQGAALDLERRDLDRFARRDLHTANGVGAFKGWNC